jgi:hypothetical protein
VPSVGYLIDLDAKTVTCPAGATALREGVA